MNLNMYNETAYLPNGEFVGREGSLWYILTEDGEKVSKKGYHYISDCGGFGKIGAAKFERIYRKPTKIAHVDRTQNIHTRKNNYKVKDISPHNPTNN